MWDGWLGAYLDLAVFSPLRDRVYMDGKKKKAENSKRVNKHVLQNPAEASTLEAKAARSNTRGDFRIKSPLCLMLGNMHDWHAHSKPPHLSKNNKKMCLFFLPPTRTCEGIHIHTLQQMVLI